MIIRKIIHIDMDAFYASVEQRDFPELRGRPLAVGGNSERGVVAAASYEARRFGVRSAMPSRTGARLCPSLHFVRPRFDVYKRVSGQIQEIFHRYTNLVEPLSLDEAYLDVTENKKSLPSATLIAADIRNSIEKETGLTASAGISINKFLAKVASDMNKPNGQKLIPPEEALEFIEKLPVARFPYVGKKTAEYMYQLGIFRGKELKAQSMEMLTRTFGKQGGYYYRVVRCEQDQPVIPNRIRKSIGAENTFEKDLHTFDEMWEKLLIICNTLWIRLEKAGVSGRTITLKLKDYTFKQSTRSHTLMEEVKKKAELEQIVHSLLSEPGIPDQPVRLLGVSLSNLTTEARKKTPTQLTLEF